MDFDPVRLPLADARLDECAASNARYLLKDLVVEDDSADPERAGEQ